MPSALPHHRGAEVAHRSGDPAPLESGTLGVPLVDANMREFRATGFMSNRGPASVASIASPRPAARLAWGAEHEVLDYDVLKYARLPSRPSLPRGFRHIRARIPHTLSRWLLVGLHVGLHARRN